jgi:hypothetical protein
MELNGTPQLLVYGMILHHMQTKIQLTATQNICYANYQESRFEVLTMVLIQIPSTLYMLHCIKAK